MKDMRKLRILFFTTMFISNLSAAVGFGDFFANLRGRARPPANVNVGPGNLVMPQNTYTYQNNVPDYAAVPRGDFWTGVRNGFKNGATKAMYGLPALMLMPSFYGGLIDVYDKVKAKLGGNSAADLKKIAVLLKIYTDRMKPLSRRSKEYKECKKKVDNLKKQYEEIEKEQIEDLYDEVAG